MSEISWSDEQLDVIDSIDSNTLVSASAGSGKTAVMIERLIRIIASGTPINQVIMVTFNNSVAQELRLKVTKALKKQLENSKDAKEREYLREQIEMVPMANISTLHSLCSNIIRENFEVVGVDPSFGIIDEDSQAVLFDNTINEVLREFEESYNENFEIVYRYLTKNCFKDIIKNLYNFIVAQPDRDEYFNNIVDYSLNSNLNEKPIVIKYYEMMRNELFQWKDMTEEYIVKFVKLGLDQVKFVDKHASVVIETIEKIVAASNIEELLNNSIGATIARIPSLTGADKNNPDVIKVHEGYGILLGRIRATIKELQSYASIPYEEHCKMALETSPFIKIICEFIRKVIYTYQLHKFDENKLDFNDLEYYSVKILSVDDIANEYHDKFKYVCVDEYQDINAVQEFILNKIANGHNLFMVGDSKQSIYGFRQTDTTIFLNKLKAYKKDNTLGKAYYLNANYRSEKCILDFVNKIFNEIMTDDFCGVDYENESQLVFGQTKYQQIPKVPIEIAICKDEKAEEVQDSDGPYYPEDWVYSIENDNREYEEKNFKKESLYIVKKIKDLVGKQEICVIEDDKPVKKLVELKDIAVLCAKRSDVQDLIKAFDKYGIPADTASMEMGNSSLEVNTLLEILKVIDNPYQDYALITALTSFIGNISMSELVEIRNICAKSVESKIKVRADGKKRQVYFYELVYDMASRTTKLASKVKDALGKIEKYRVVASFSTVSDLLKRIMFENNYDEIVLMKEDGKQRLKQVMLYIDSIKDKYYNNSLSEFIKNVSSAPILKQTSQEDSADSNSVIISTLHQSKGLEYPIVFYMGCCNDFEAKGVTSANSSKILLDKDFGMAMPALDTNNLCYEENLVYHAMKKYQDYNEIKEKMRLMYVGLTRAKNMLFVTGSVKAAKNEKPHIIDPKEAKKFMDWILYTGDKNEEFKKEYFTTEELNLESLPKEKNLEIKFDKPLDLDYLKVFDKITIEYEHEASKTLGVKHTVTEINRKNYEEVQSYGDLNYVENKTGYSQAAIGTAMHRALELIDFDLTTLEEVTKALDQMVEEDKMLPDQRALVQDEVILKCLQSSIIDIAKKNTHYREKLFILNVHADVLFSDIGTKDRVMLEGVIDLLIDTPKGYILVDYKHSQKSDSLLKQAYQTQLDLYASAIRLTTGRKVLSKNILVIDDGRVVNLD